MENSDKLTPSELEAQFKRVLAAEQESASFGLMALRSAILVNAGAIAALLAFAGQVWGKQGGNLSPALYDARWFVFGLLVAIAATVTAYIFVDSKSAGEDRRLEKMKEGRNAPGVMSHDAPVGAVHLWGLLTGLLALASYVMFCVGAWRVLAALGG